LTTHIIIQLILSLELKPARQKPMAMLVIQLITIIPPKMNANYVLANLIIALIVMQHIAS
jgi:hypothetical protein